MTEIASPVQLLLLDDDEDDYILLKAMLKDAFADTVRLDWYQKDGVATEMICSGMYQVTFVDYWLGQENGLEVIRQAKERCPDRVIFLYTDWKDQIHLDPFQHEEIDGVIRKSELSITSLKQTLKPYLFVGKDSLPG